MFPYNKSFFRKFTLTCLFRDQLHKFKNNEIENSPQNHYLSLWATNKMVHTSFVYTKRNLINKVTKFIYTQTYIGIQKKNINFFFHKHLLKSQEKARFLLFFTFLHNLKENTFYHAVLFNKSIIFLNIMYIACTYS